MHKKILIWGVLLAVLGGSASMVTLYLHKSKSPVTIKKTTSPIVQDHAIYKLDLLSGSTYAVNQPTALRFSLKDQSGKLFKDFDSTQTATPSIAVIRKDFMDFQHTYPIFNDADGTFSTPPITFIEEGEYRIFVDFTANSARTGFDGRKLTTNAYEDILVGNPASNNNHITLQEKQSSVVGSYTASFFFPPGDDSPGSVPDTTFYAGQEKTLAISVDKYGQAFKNLESTNQALGLLAIFDTNLSLNLVKPSLNTTDNQTGLLIFNLKPTQVGVHKMFLQIKAENQELIFDFTIDVKDIKSTNKR